MLKGQAKTDYQREYMRRRRAGLTAKPKPEWQPTQRIVDEIADWGRERLSGRIWHLKEHQRQIIDGLLLDTEESWMEACRRYKQCRDERQAEKEKQAQREVELEAESKIIRCSFCGEPASKNGIMISKGYRNICENCVAEANKMIVAARKRQKQSA